MELVIRNITPAKVDMNIKEVESFIVTIKEKYENIIFSEKQIDEAKTSRTSLNKLEKNISDVRKKIEKESKIDIEKLINTLKQAEKDVKELSNNIGSQIKTFEEQEWKEKLEEINVAIRNIFENDTNLIDYIKRNEKWKNKTFTISKIKDEVESELSRLKMKKDFILEEIKKSNEEISFKILFEKMIYLLNYEYSDITNIIRSEKEKIKATEENIRKRAEEEKIRALEELEAKKEIEKQQAIEKAQNKPVQEENRNAQENVNEVKKSCENVKYFNTTIRFEKAPLTFLKELKILSDRYQITYELKENIEL